MRRATPTRIRDGIFGRFPVLLVHQRRACAAGELLGNCEEKMKTFSVTLIVCAVGLAFVAVSPAEAAKKKRHHHSGYAASAMSPGGTAATYQGGVMAGPLYNGQDYLGDDPDPNIRSYLLRDLTGRYGGGR